MKKYRLLLIFVATFLFALPLAAKDGAYANLYQYLNDGVPQNLACVSAKLGEKEVDLLLARTNAERSKGYMFRRYIPKNQGMLFVYKYPHIMSYWMKNTMLPLDLVLLSSDLKVVEFILKMEPGYGFQDAELKHYISKKPAKYAIEFNAGTVESLDIRIGDELKISPLCLYCE